MISKPSVWIGRAPAAGIPEGASKVFEQSGRGCGDLAAASVTARNRQPSESDVVHDHIRLGQHQIGAIACIGVGIGTRHVKHAGTTQRGETVGGSSGSSRSAGSTEMLDNGCPDANDKVLIKSVSEHLLPTAQAW